jgi:GT2 family glycosyltransferase
VAESPKVIALVLNWRLVGPTLQVLADLLASGFHGLHTVLADNGSGDGSAERLAGAIEGREDVEVLAIEENLGYCAAINLGLERARARDAPYVCILNNDVRLPPGFLDPMVELLDRDAELAAVGPTIVDQEGRVWSEGGGVGFRPNLVFLRNQGGAPTPSTCGPEDVEFLPGACALYRLEDLAAIGDLEEDYFMYWEDVDLGARLRAAGRRLAWIPTVRVVHEASLSSGGGRTPMRKYMMAANSVHYLRRHGRATDWLAFVLFDLILWPLSIVSGTGLRAALGKGRGLIAGIRGHKISVADVERFLHD